MSNFFMAEKTLNHSKYYTNSNETILTKTWIFGIDETDVLEAWAVARSLEGILDQEVISFNLDLILDTTFHPIY